MNTPGPMLKLARVAAIALSLGMLAWFVYRSSGGRAASSGSEPNATRASLEVPARSVATSSKSLDSLLVGVEGKEGEPVLAPSSKSISQPIFSVKKEAGEAVLMPGSKSLSFPVVKLKDEPEASSSPTPSPAVAPSSPSPTP